MLAVGAASWATPSTIEDFSSRGPTTDGRVKPDVVGADRGNSASYGPSGFFGTSQASPHVAGLVALVLEQFPSFTPTQVADYLKTNALPRGAVPNNSWGYGLAQLPSLESGEKVLRMRYKDTSAPDLSPFQSASRVAQWAFDLTRIHRRRASG